MDAAKNYGRKTKLDEAMHLINIVRGDGFDAFFWIPRSLPLSETIRRIAEHAPDPIEVYYPDVEQTKECEWCHQMNKESNLFCWHCKEKL